MVNTGPRADVEWTEMAVEREEERVQAAAVLHFDGVVQYHVRDIGSRVAEKHGLPQVAHHCDVHLQPE